MSLRILLSEGSSTNARETITALGLAGHTVDVCDPNPICLARCSRFVRHVHRVPASGASPLEYLRAVERLLRDPGYDVLLPVNEQAYLFAWAADRLRARTGLAVADFAAFTQVQTKDAFLHLADELGLPHPPTRVVADWAEARPAALELGLPCFVKTAAGTASSGVWRIDSVADLDRLLAGPAHEVSGPLLVQAVAHGSFEQSHAVFDDGRLVALRCTRRLAEGARGGALLKVGVTRPAVVGHYELLGRRLRWHGGFSADYFWDDSRERPSYIDANPRITEPMNALRNGVNLAELQVRLSLGEHPARVPDETRSARSHTALQAMLGAAAHGRGRRGALVGLATAATGSARFQGSREGVTPLRLDPPSGIALAVVLGRLLLDPNAAEDVAAKAIADYALGAEAIALLAQTSHPAPDAQ